MTATGNAILEELQMAKLKPYLVPALIFLMAAGILVTIIGNWNSWASDRVERETDDAYVRADLTPLSTRVSGVVAKVLVDDYQTVKAGDFACAIARRRLSRAGRASGSVRRGSYGLKGSAYSKRCGQPNEVLVPAPLAPENVGADHEFNARFSHAGCGIPRTRDYEHDPLYS
jgi:hypothetical protein